MSLTRLLALRRERRITRQRLAQLVHPRYDYMLQRTILYLEPYGIGRDMEFANARYTLIRALEAMQ